jgi:MSHA biogenesis protein MshI
VVGVHASSDSLVAVRINAPQSAAELAGVRSAAPGELARIAQGGWLAGARLHLALPAGAYETALVTTPPAVPDEELAEALRWQLRGTLSIAPENAILDLVHLPRPPGASSDPLLVVAAARSVVRAALAPFDELGLEVDAVDIPEFAQRNLLIAEEQPDAPGCRGFLSLAGNSALLTVQMGADLCFARRMSLPQMDDEPEHLADRIATQVQRSLEVFARQSRLPDVLSLTVGPHPHAPLLARAVHEQAEIPAPLFDPGMILSGTSAQPQDTRSLQTAEAAIALGMALRRERAAGATRLARLPGWLRLPRAA